MTHRASSQPLPSHQGRYAALRVGLLALALLLPTACSLAPPMIREHRWLTFGKASQRRVAEDLHAAALAWDAMQGAGAGG